MTTQEKIQEIRLKCIEVNPDIIKLEFGCKVWVDDSNGEEGYSIWEYIGDVDLCSNQDTLWKCVHSTFATVLWGNFKLEGKPYVILGRPITLADILLTINRVQNKSYSFSSAGIFERWEHSRDSFWSLEEYKGSWHLLKSLEDQDKSTIDFIHGVVCE